MWNSESYTIAAYLLPRFLGLIYFFAIGALLLQIKGLLGRNGILPISTFLSQFQSLTLTEKWFYIPSLFWLNTSDTNLRLTLVIGLFTSIALLLGFFPSLCLAVLFIVYLSIVTTGQEFLSFGWESFLLEITFYTFFVSLTTIPNPMIWLCINLLLFRFFIQAGAVKLQSHDFCWRDLTALSYHYESQPLPNMWAWFIHRWPLSFHKLSTFFMFIVELILPFGLFFNDFVRAIVGLNLIGLQVLIWMTGNLSFLNHLTIVFCVIAFSNQYLSIWVNPPVTSQTSWFLNDLLSCIGLAFIILQLVRLWNHFVPQKKQLETLLRLVSFFHLVNRYGLFAIMTKERHEIVIEGSEDGKVWQEYLCKYKPSEITRRPRRISPFQPRLDWQMWFLPFDNFESASWFHQFLYHLLIGTPEVLRLLRHNPFPHAPPKFIRALIYDYKFSTSQQRIEKGWWWQRKLLGSFSPTLRLKEEAQLNPSDNQ